MKSIILAMTVLVSTQAFASDLVKTYDGTIATCQSNVDVESHAIGAIYRPVKLEKSDKTATITIEFLKCTKDGFVRDLSVEKRVTKVTDLSTRDLSKVEVSMQRSSTQLLAFNGLGELIDRQALNRNEDGTYSAKINIDVLNLDDAPTGKKSLEVAVQSVFELKNSKGELIDNGFENLGSYRLIVK